MEEIGPRIETGLLFEFGRELPTALVSISRSLTGRNSGLQSAVDSDPRSCQIQKVFMEVTDQHRLKFTAKFLLHGNSLLHSLSTLENHHLSAVLSSPDRLHRTLHIRDQNRGTSRNGLIDGETFDVSESSRSHRVLTSHLFAQWQAADKSFELISFKSSQRIV
jgi:hypothetical protein